MYVAVSARDRERNNRSFTLNSRLISWPQHERNSSADHFAVTWETAAASIHFIFFFFKEIFFFSFFHQGYSQRIGSLAMSN
jgi:hypothetical protein